MLQGEIYLYLYPFSLQLINRLLSVMDTACVLCAVRTGLKYNYVQGGPRKSSPPSFCTCPCDILSGVGMYIATDPDYFFVAHPEGRPRKSRVCAKRKSGYYFVAHSVYVRQFSKGLSLKCGHFLHASSVSAEGMH